MMTEKQKRFGELYPDAFFLSKEEPEQLADFLRTSKWIATDEQVLLIEKPGEGNMNYVLRVRTDRQSFIVKQSRPWVEKYPQIDAPIERIMVEAQFYDTLSEDPALKAFIPFLKGFKAHDYLMAVEDLGDASDFTTIYQKNEEIKSAELAELMQFISALHRIDVREFREPFPANQELKELNAEHIFEYPYLVNGFDLDTIQEGLQALSMLYKRNEVLKEKIKALCEVYLGNGDVLIHGDYYPGSWLRTAKGTKVIDPEFAYVGNAELDLAVMVAHLIMAQTDNSLILEGLQNYALPAHFNHSLFAGFCGAEILRRIIGLAQLPLDLSLADKAELLRWAANSVMEPAINKYLQKNKTKILKPD
jgi:5-methylthioribose kinase